MSNKVYDVLKWIALVGLPPLAVFIQAIGGIWSIPYTEAIAGTVMAIDALLGAWVGVSSVQYNKNNKEG